jgi:putative transcriptional regulator
MAINNEIKIGSALIADPHIEDDNFKETVVLLTELQDDGVYGFSINKKMALQLHEMIQEVKADDIDVFYGGPVGLNTLQFIHNAPAIFKDAIHLMEGVYLGGDFDLLVQKINSKQIQKGQYKIFMGYCGWDIAQLLTELYEEESWLTHTLPATDILLQQTNNIYKNALKTALAK